MSYSKKTQRFNTLLKGKIKKIFGSYVKDDFWRIIILSVTPKTKNSISAPKHSGFLYGKREFISATWGIRYLLNEKIYNMTVTQSFLEYLIKQKP